MTRERKSTSAHPHRAKVDRKTKGSALTPQERIFQMEELLTGKDMKIDDLERGTEYLQARVDEYRRLYREERQKLIGALLAVQAITKPGEPNPFLAG